ncbi:hypothetical protein [Klebsiella grimontii]|uniref:hypothetical protein n=1 Tax=Klebsiella grimontii TaxID=2058152 RepID=UPI001CCF0F14|nr:hypothetical protein [Klebsiella grimontii]MDU2707521.1 hypothetical protein [Klebsiella grimontii]MDV0334449.1 hypothetical protein [Klebsiella grimontii]MDV0377628.1 hypothetical protein [Klebsiella grimontii]MDV0386756.1 hypothetical protein [Klebsiella grimontii]MDV0409660.1 hypothetical protein [Klebsiella grimontii]
MTALQRHTLCWLEPSTLDEIAAQLEDEFGHLPAVLRQQAREYLLSGRYRASYVAACGVRIVFRLGSLSHCAGKGSECVWPLKRRYQR